MLEDIHLLLPTAHHKRRLTALRALTPSRRDKVIHQGFSLLHPLLLLVCLSE